MRNPFTPTFGIVPPYLAGRGSILSDMTRAFDNWPGDPNLSTILIGPRGSGKTAMLSCIGDIASEKGWVVADTTASVGMLEDIFQRTCEVAADILDNNGGKHITGIEIGSIIGINWENETLTPANWRTRMSKILKELKENGSGLLITVDEVRADIDEMIRLASIYQLFVREGARIALVMAGLPINVNDLLSDESVSFLRRSRQHQLDRIPDIEVRTAFRLTVESAGKTIEDDALEQAVNAAGGFAYMMQLVGYQMWDISRDRAVICNDDVSRGTEIAYRDFRNGVLNNTIRELSAGDIKFLRAMLEDNESSSISDIARRLGRKPGYASTYKRRLLQAGVIEETNRAHVTFAIPMLREYLQE